MIHRHHPQAGRGPSDRSPFKACPCLLSRLRSVLRPRCRRCRSPGRQTEAPAPPRARDRRSHHSQRSECEARPRRGACLPSPARFDRSRCLRPFLPGAGDTGDNPAADSSERTARKTPQPTKGVPGSVRPTSVKSSPHPAFRKPRPHVHRRTCARRIGLPTGTSATCTARTRNPAAPRMTGLGETPTGHMPAALRRIPTEPRSFRLPGRGAQDEGHAPASCTTGQDSIEKSRQPAEAPRTRDRCQSVRALHALSPETGLAFCPVDCAVRFRQPEGRCIVLAVAGGGKTLPVRNTSP